MHAEFTKTGVGIAVSPQGDKIIVTQIFLE
ncbi:MAG: hypothetical protein HYX86_05175 [Chloroflexi bacterium]|nr:hypothetical protein [Chloroflexota bacterium]